MMPTFFKNHTDSRTFTGSPTFTGFTRALALGAWLLAAVLSLPGLAAAQGGASYLLGPGDVVKITIYNQPDLATEAQIAASGSINFPLIGEVVLAGLDKGQAENRLAQLLAERKVVLKPQVNVLITAYRSQQVSVIGQVTKPGRIPLDTQSSVTDLLAYAGGIAPTGSDVVVVIARDRNGGYRKREIDLNSMIMSGNLSDNVPIANGDVIYVPRAPLFYIYGEVQKPGVYRLERNLTVMQALSVGGGLTGRGTERGVRLHRRDPKGVVQTVEPKLTDTVEENDVVFVRESVF